MGILDTLAPATCSSCHYWIAKQDIQVGECRRVAPYTSDAIAGHWPLTAPEQWCGEWERRQEPLQP